LLVPPGQVRQLHAQDSSLDCIHAAVPADFLVMVTSRAAVIAQIAHALRHSGIAGGDHAGIAVGAQVLSGIKTESGRRAQGPCAGVPPFRADGLGGVFDDGEFEFFGDGMEFVHVGALAEEMDRQQRGNFARVGGELLPYAAGIDIQRRRIDIHQNRTCPGADNRTGRGEKTEGGGDDGIAGLDSGGDERQP
jgi:hypothetical protein